MTEELNCIGKAAARPEAPEKVTGKAVYAGDLSLSGMLHGVVLRSPHPHARILTIDTSAARALQGVEAVLTAADLPRRRLGEKIKDQPVLAEDMVRFVGERVAAVAALDEATARRAAGLIRVEYEPLPAVFDIEEALGPEAPLVHADSLEYLKPQAQVQGNVYGYERIATGAIEAGWSQSDYIFEDSFSTQAVHQGYQENHVIVALAEPDGRATIWSCNKVPFPLRRELANYIGILEDYLRIVAPPIGGDFGGKSAVMDEPLCYYLSLLTGRPVRMAMTRREELAAANPRHPSLITIKSGVKKNGQLVARQVKILFNSGAYGGVKSSLVLLGYNKAAGPYRIPHLLIEGYAVYTNNEPRGQCRAPGQPQAVFALESHMDIIAKGLGLDPLAFRLRNVLTEGEADPAGERWHDLRGREVLETAARVAGWQRPRAAGTGLGMALAFRGTGGGVSGAEVKVGADGSVEVLTGAVETGTGSWTILQQIAAEELGVTPEMVRVVPGDTSVAPYDCGNAASRSTHVAGWAVRQASQEAAAILGSTAARMLGGRPEEIVSKGGRFWPASHPEQSLAFAQVAEKAAEQGPIVGLGRYEGQKKDTTAFACHVAEVMVDREAGAVEVTRLVAVQDIGRILNPPAAEGQVEGSAVQGLGFTLWEDLVKEEGRLCSSSLADYHQPSSLDMPEMEVVFLEGARGPAPYGSKGLGELPIVPVAAAIANALEDATGVRIKDLPLTPEKVWLALQKGGFAPAS